MTRKILLARVHQLEIQVDETKRDFENHWMTQDRDLYNARSNPGGIIQTMEQDVARLRHRIKEEFPE